MKLPLRYRIAMRAYPASYRADRGDEIAATLAETDDANGGPSVRETVGLIRGGFGARSAVDLAAPPTLVAAAAMCALAFSPGRFWNQVNVDGIPEVTGPLPWVRILLIAVSVIAAGAVIGAHRGRAVQPWRGALVVGALNAGLLAAADLQRTTLFDLSSQGSAAGRAGRVAAVVAVLAVPVLLALVNRLPATARAIAGSALLASAALVAAAPLVKPGLGPAAIAIGGLVPLALFAGWFVSSPPGRLAPQDP